MEKINDFYLPQLHNGENVNFHHESLEQLDKADPAKLGVMEQTKVYHAAYDELKLTVDVFSTSTLSAESTRLDTLRDRAYSAFKSYVKVYLNDEDEGKSEAAERIIAVIRNTERELGTPLLLGLSKETTVLFSLVRNLDSLAADVDRIGATDRLKSLENANQAYADLQFERYIEKSTKHSGDVKAARAVVDAAYKDIIARINARILLNGDEGFVPYVKAQNVVIEHYKFVVAQRRGRSEKETTNGTETKK
ncbi:MAG: DUF6261 family protein [Tannerella sp.]|jgi:hypothetical protein|nr:DUF6261 family protein [Tannerella sp.]